MKVLVIGSGGREHAIIAALKKSPKITSIHAAPGNGGISSIATCHDVKATDIDGIVKLAREITADWVFVTPDDPLVLGAVDALEDAGFKTFGPKKNAAILEGSKAFSKSFMERNNIPTAAYKTFDNCDNAIEFVKTNNTYPVVVKCDGLALGKGVIIANDEGEAISAIKSIMVEGKFGDSGKQIVIEEYLDGVEVTVLAFTDGKSIVPMPPSTDHKRALDGDKGLNTGGMGVVSPIPYYTDEIADSCMSEIFLPTIKALEKEGRVFKGCLYFGLMITKNGVKVIEYNCRFGDPETQCILPLLETDLYDIMASVYEGELCNLDIRFSNKSSACVVVASGGYPEKYSTGHTIKGIENAQDKGVYVYQAGTKLCGDRVITSGGRVLAVTAVDSDLESAVDKAYDAVSGIEFEGMHYRRDIGRKALNP